MIGQTIGKYRIVETLGRGGMGTVYKGVDETLDREVAIKILNPELAEADVMKRFRAEATTLAKLNHPDIATIYEIYRSGNDLLMVMELIRGETLDKLIQRSAPLPPERAAYLASQVLGALEHAHRAGIVHRDLKPTNVMVTETGGIKVMDFGIARVAGAEHLTNDGFMMGTPAYMAPEQALGEEEVDARADLYSVGVVLYRMLSGHLPFQADTAIAMVRKQIAEAPTPLRTHRAGLPTWCEAILDRALAKSPADRYQTSETFRTALLEGMGGAASEHTTPLSIPAVNAGAPPIPPQPRTTPPPAAIPVPAALQPTAAIAIDGPTIVLKKNQFAMAAGLLAILALGVGVLAVVALRRPSTAAAPAVPTSPSTAATAAPTPPSTPATAVPTPPASISGPASMPAPAAPATSTQAAAPTVKGAPIPLKAAPPTPPTPTAGQTTAAVAPASTTAARPPAPAKARKAPAAAVVAPPLVFDAKALVPDGSKQKERDAKLLLSDGKITVTADNKVLWNAVPYGAVETVSYSNSKQPLWNSPDGPAPVLKVGGGAFGFMKGGRHWVSLRTPDSVVVLRVEAEQVRPLLTAFEERTGRTPERVAERKD